MGRLLNLHIKHKQQGAALLLIMLVLVIGMATFYVSAVDPERLRIKQQQKTIESMGIAKEAIIAYAVGHYKSKTSVGVQKFEFIRLPCPDFSTFGEEGAQDGDCGTTTANNHLGRFPWRSLELDAIRDGQGECLWYGVSGNFKNSLTEDMINGDSKGRIDIYDKDGLSRLYGGNVDNRIIAAIIAPGAAVKVNGVVQNRKPPSDTEAKKKFIYCHAEYTASNYLEAFGTINNADFKGAAAGIGKLIHFGNANDPEGNDIILPITRDEILTAVMSRSDFIPKMNLLTKQVAECIAEFTKKNAGWLVDKRMPYAAPVLLSNYHQTSNYNDQNLRLNGRIPLTVDDSKFKIDNTGTNNLLVGCPNDLKTSGTEASALLKHWKDHLFYAVSMARTPDSATPAHLCTAASCVSVSGARYGAIVFYSGSALPTQTRNTPPDTAVDTKQNIENYLENKNSVRFSENSGNGVGFGEYEANQIATSAFNDIAYCIGAYDLSVTLCP